MRENQLRLMFMDPSAWRCSSGPRCARTSCRFPDETCISPWRGSRSWRPSFDRMHASTSFSSRFSRILSASRPLSPTGAFVPAGTLSTRGGWRPRDRQRSRPSSRRPSVCTCRRAWHGFSRSGRLPSLRPRVSDRPAVSRPTCPEPARPPGSRLSCEPAAGQSEHRRFDLHRSGPCRISIEHTAARQADETPARRVRVPAYGRSLIPRNPEFAGMNDVAQEQTTVRSGLRHGPSKPSDENREPASGIGFRQDLYRRAFEQRKAT